MNLDALKAAVVGANGAGAPTLSPAATGANAFTQAAIQHIQALAGISQRSDATNAAGNALYGGVKQQASTDAANENAAHDAAVQAAKDKADKDAQLAQDLADPTKYQKVVDDSGGYKYYTPDGKQLSAQDYAGVTNQHVTDVLKGSQNTTDQQFMEDYKEVQALGEAAQSGKMADYLKKNPGIADQLKKAGVQKYSDVVKNFRSSYPQYFTQGQTQDIGSATYNNTPVKAAGGESVLDKIKSFFGS